MTCWFLTKALGTGVLTTGAKAGLVSEENYAALIASMTTLNNRTGEEIVNAGAHACTDVTGFGLLGHALEMAVGSSVTLRLYTQALPLLPGARELAEMGIILLEHIGTWTMSDQIYRGWRRRSRLLPTCAPILKPRVVFWQLCLQSGQSRFWQRCGNLHPTV